MRSTGGGARAIARQFNRSPCTQGSFAEDGRSEMEDGGGGRERERKFGRRNAKSGKNPQRLCVSAVKDGPDGAGPYRGLNASIPSGKNPQRLGVSAVKPDLTAEAQRTQRGLAF